MIETSTITCPKCGHRSTEHMPADANFLAEHSSSQFYITPHQRSSQKRAKNFTSHKKPRNLAVPRTAVTTTGNDRIMFLTPY